MTPSRAFAAFAALLLGFAGAARAADGWVNARSTWFDVGPDMST